MPASGYAHSRRRTGQPVRALDAAALGIEPALTIPEHPTAVSASLPRLPDSDPHIDRVRTLLRSYGGVIFSGPPGTSKSYYASAIALKLADDDPERVRFVQFHPSYQYEDFVEGFVPAKGTFVLRNKHLLDMCQRAISFGDRPVFIVVDELNRTDPGRVFGEALTYLELSKRGISFKLASGTETSLPPNLFIIATMNTLDRGVEEVDLALQRRFARIDMPPDPSVLASMLVRRGVDASLRERIVAFFNWTLSQPNELARVGQAYFVNVSDEDSLRVLWDHQLRFHVEKAFRLDPDGLAEYTRRWRQIIGAPQDTSAGTAEEPVAGASEEESAR